MLRYRLYYPVYSIFYILYYGTQYISIIQNRTCGITVRLPLLPVTATLHSLYIGSHPHVLISVRRYVRRGTRFRNSSRCLNFLAILVPVVFIQYPYSITGAIVYRPNQTQSALPYSQLMRQLHHQGPFTIMQIQRSPQTFQSDFIPEFCIISGFRYLNSTGTCANKWLPGISKPAELALPTTFNQSLSSDTMEIMQVGMHTLAEDI